ncbi:MAG: T9SS type A sorting domain-containing protein [Bacteroidia bacterium]|nr:T9SS type A sorting domain-containing protein [Bacteroidia bacterium]
MFTTFFAKAQVNDQCSGAITVTCGNSYSGTTVGATTTNDPTGSCGTSVDGPGVWYKFIGTGNSVTASLCGSSYDTKLHIFSGTCASYICVDGNDDFCSLQSEVSFNTTVGVTYYIFVSGYSSNTGAYTLAINCCTPSVPGITTNPTPSNGSININSCSLDFFWTAPANSGCNAATSYDFYFGTSATPPFISNLTTTSYAIPNALSDNTTYYWKVVSINALGSAVGSTTWSFTTGTSTNQYYCLYNSAINYPTAGPNCVQLTSAASTQNGCAWNRNKISFASAFDYSVQMYFGATAGGADGCAFVFQNSPQGISQCGSTGGQLGAGGIPNAVVVEFDTYDNDFPTHNYDMSVDHTAIEIDGDMQGPGAPLAGPVQADPLDGLLADGLLHTLRVTWNPAAPNLLSVYVDGSLRISRTYDFVNNVFGGNPNVWWGFTGSTGLLANQQYFCPVSIPLPVNIINFSANCFEGKNQLVWETSSETNNDFFTVERSEDGRIFQKITEVDGAGNSNDITHYSWIDYNPLEGNSYYRLSQTDYDGKTEIFPLKNINCKPSLTELNIKTVFNSDKKIFAEFEISASGDYTIEILNLLGEKINTKNLFLDKGLINTDFNVTDFKSGIYVLSIYDNNQTAVKKFIIQ